MYHVKEVKRWAMSASYTNSNAKCALVHKKKKDEQNVSCWWWDKDEIMQLLFWYYTMFVENGFFVC